MVQINLVLLIGDSFDPYTDIDMIDKVKENSYYLLKDKHKNIDKIKFLINTFYEEKNILTIFPLRI